MRYILLLLMLCGANAASAQLYKFEWSKTQQIHNNKKIHSQVNFALASGLRPSVAIIFHEQADVSLAQDFKGKSAKGHYVYQTLLATAERTQANARYIIRQHGAKANSLFIVNAIAVADCDEVLARQLAKLPEVRSIVLDPWAYMEPPVQTSDNQQIAGDRSATEWGIERIKAPALWAMGYTGQGIVVGGADTGYDWTHPTLRPHYRGVLDPIDSISHHYNWHDAVVSISPLNSNPDNPCGLGTNAPCDDQSHGTHTMGTMVGDDNLGNQIGVAPGAKWIGCRNMERGWGQPSTYLGCFQWFLAPTDTFGLNADPDMAPHVINNSWYCAESEGCNTMEINELMRTAIVNLKAAGVFVVVSNGNFGGQGCSSANVPPAYFEESFSIGATQPNDTIAGFSSRGPVTIDLSNRTKPNVCAPGTQVRSSTPNGGFASFSGTSMAGPHVAGMVALLLSARPELIGEVDQLENYIEQSCIQRNGHQDCSDFAGMAYPNNTYGYGIIDALATLTAIPSSTTDQPTKQLEVLCYPNPAHDKVFFTLKWALSSGKITLFNAKGQVHATQNIPASAAPVTIEIPTHNLPAGIYFWQAQTADGVQTGKVVVR
jgi:serine protease AprX